MKKVLRIISMILGILVLALLAGGLFIQLRGIPTYDPPAYTLKVAVTPERVERGYTIASMMCIQCHSGASGRLTGKRVEDLPASFGEIYSMNLTHDPVYGIGNWTDGELYAFLRTGVRPDGTFAPTYMPKYPLMAEYDIESLIAWLRSDRPEVQATQEEAPPSKPSFFTKFLTNVAIKPLPMPAAPIQVPDTQETVAFGRYVADGVYACWACHSADFARQNSLQPSLSFHFYGGGNPMLNLSGEVVPSSNLTPDAQGLPGGYDAAGFLDALKYGKKKNGELTRYPMIPHTILSDTEVHAVYAYLKTVPPLPDLVSAGK